MKTVSSIANAVQELREQGFLNTFNIQNHSIYCLDQDREIPAEQLILVEQYHVDNAGDEDATTHEVYAVTTADNVKGIMLDTYAEYDADEFAELFSRINKNAPQAEA